MDWNAKEYSRNAFYVSRYGEELIEILDPHKGEYILDLGCGDGTLARKIGERGPRMHCVDYSETMVMEARKKGIPSTVLDAHKISFDQTFDAVFSNAAMHWMKQPKDILRNVFRALKPGGRFVAELGGTGNLLTITDAITRILKEEYRLDYRGYDPWFFPTVDEYRALLTEAGFEIASLTLFERPTPLPHGFVEWFRLFAEPFLVDIPPEKHDQFCQQVARAVQPKLYDSAKEVWIIDYVRLRFVARRSA